jgi:hypothetical protein
MANTLDDLDQNDDFCLWEESLPEAPNFDSTVPLADPHATKPPARNHHLLQSDDYLEHNGQVIHKQTFCWLHLSRDSPHLSHDRLSRWRGFNSAHQPVSNGIETQKADVQDTDEALGDNLVVSDLVATLLRSGSCISLAVLMVTAINEGMRLLTEVDLETLSNEWQNIKITGQLMSLTAVPTVVLGADMNTSTEAGRNIPDTEPEELSTWSWLWTGGYAKAKAAVAGTDEVLEKVIIVNVPGHLTMALNPRMVSADSLKNLHLPDNELSQLNSKRLLWIFDNGGLGLVHDTIWERVSASGIVPGSLVLVKPLTDFPYQLAGRSGLICEAGSDILKSDHFSGVNLVCNCHFCGQKVEGAPKWRSHIGEHVLRKVLSVNKPSSSLGEPVCTSIVLDSNVHC